MLGPFFVQEAARKGVSMFLSGFIFAVFEFVVVISSPAFGFYLTKFGVKRQYLTGIFLSAICIIIFGLLDYVEDTNTFFVSCMVLRSLEGLGYAAEFSASFAIIVRMYPERAASLIAMMESFSGVGMMVGPMYGAVLYHFGGFSTPFVASGAILLILSVIACCLIESQEGDNEKKNEISFSRFIIIPEVIFAGFIIFYHCLIFGYLDVSFATHVESLYKFNTLKIGLVFMIVTSSYAISTPLWGRLSEKVKGCNRILLVAGLLISSSSMFTLGPSLILNIKTHPIWLMCVSQLCIGIGGGTLAITIHEFIDSTKRLQLEQNIETYGIVSGVIFSFSSAGFFFGPIYGGSMVKNYGFAASSSYIGFAGYALIITCILFYMLRKKITIAPENNDERTPLLT